MSSIGPAEPHVSCSMHDAECNNGQQIQSLLSELHMSQKLFTQQSALSDAMNEMGARRGYKLPATINGDNLKRLWSLYGILVVPSRLSCILHGKLATTRGCLDRLLLSPSVACDTRSVAPSLPVMVKRQKDNYAEMEFHTISFFSFKWASDCEVKWYNSEGNLVVVTSSGGNLDQVFLLEEICLDALAEEEKNLFRVCICDRGGRLARCVRSDKEYPSMRASGNSGAKSYKEITENVLNKSSGLMPIVACQSSPALVSPATLGATIGDNSYPAEEADQYFENLKVSLAKYLCKTEVDMNVEMDFIKCLMNAMVCEKQAIISSREQLNGLVSILNTDVMIKNFKPMTSTLIEHMQDCACFANLLTDMTEMFLSALALQGLSEANERLLKDYNTEKSLSLGCQNASLIDSTLMENFKLFHRMISALGIPSVPSVPSVACDTSACDTRACDFEESVLSQPKTIEFLSRELQDLWHAYTMWQEDTSSVTPSVAGDTRAGDTRAGDTRSVDIYSYSQSLNNSWYIANAKMSQDAREDVHLDLFVLQNVFVEMILKNCVKNGKGGQAVCLLMQTAYLSVEVRNMLQDLPALEDEVFLLEVTVKEINFNLWGNLQMRFRPLNAENFDDALVLLPSDGIVLLPVVIAGALKKSIDTCGIKGYTLHSEPEKGAIAKHVANILDDYRTKHSGFTNEQTGSFWNEKIQSLFDTLALTNQVSTLMECFDISKKMPLDKKSFLYVDCTQEHSTTKEFLTEQIFSFLEHDGKNPNAIKLLIEKLNAAYELSPIVDTRPKESIVARDNRHVDDPVSIVARDNRHATLGNILLEFKIYMQFVFVLFAVSHSLKLQSVQDQVWPITVLDEHTLQFLPGKGADSLYDACLKITQGVLGENPNELTKHMVKDNIKKLIFSQEDMDCH